MSAETTQCPTCKKFWASGTGGKPFPCVNCWEVEHRLDLYLQSAEGRKIVTLALAKASPGRGHKPEERGSE